MPARCRPWIAGAAAARRHRLSRILPGTRDFAILAACLLALTIVLALRVAWPRLRAGRRS